MTVTDPREAFLTAERLPDCQLHHGWPDEILPQLQIDSRTAVVSLTHDEKIDDPALDIALRSDAFYIGALGSKRTHAARVDRLIKKGHPEEHIGRIRAPIGLNIGSRGPGEIALSILAQIIQTWRTMV